MRPAPASCVQASTWARKSLAWCGETSRPSVNAWITRSWTPASAAIEISAFRWRSLECTPPSEASPIRCTRGASSSAACSTSLAASEPSWTASSIRARSCLTIAPAPRLRWPTSELPIWPSGSPTSRPWAESWVCGYCPQRRSKTGVWASEIALPGPGSARPQPSRMTSASEGTNGVRTLRPSCGLDDRGEVLGVQRGAADEGAVDVGQGEQLGGVVGLDRTAVEDPDSVGGGAAPAQHVADEGAHLLGLLGGGDV